MGKDNLTSDQSTSAAAPARALDLGALENLLLKSGEPESCCAALSKVFGVRPNEVALLRLDNGLLKFLFPSELATAGSIPISSSTAVAAHTAVTKKIELFNNFASVKHASIFESVKPKALTDGEPGPSTIYKLMSAPVLDKADKILGVIQISHKGYDLPSAGPDFTPDDLQKLELVAKVVAQVEFMRESS